VSNPFPFRIFSSAALFHFQPVCRSLATTVAPLRSTSQSQGCYGQIVMPFVKRISGCNVFDRARGGNIRSSRIDIHEGSLAANAD
jgi:hypothetical protein